MRKILTSGLGEGKSRKTLCNVSLRFVTETQLLGRLGNTKVMAVATPTRGWLGWWEIVTLVKSF